MSIPVIVEISSHLPVHPVIQILKNKILDAGTGPALQTSSFYSFSF
jgi:hypothetical protein